MVMVTLPALAESDVVLNLRAPLGSAEIFSDEPLPDPLLAGVLVAGVLAAGAGVELALVEVLPPPLPQPAIARTAAAEPRTSNVGMHFKISPPDRVWR